MNILEKIVVIKKEEVKKLKKNFSLEAFDHFEFYHNECLSFADAISMSGKISIISEIKKASPSKGILKPNFNHIEIAEAYINSGVDAISILTDEVFFQGSIEYLNEIAFIKTVPLLRKDFIIDEIQIHQAKAYGADAILLISEILDASQIRDFTQIAQSLGLSILMELHSIEMLSKIDTSLNTIIGVNNRNLEDFSVSLDTTASIKKHLSSNVSIVSESGISTKADIDNLKQTGVDAVLVGEHFMKNDDIESAVREMIEWCRHEN